MRPDDRPIAPASSASSSAATIAASSASVGGRASAPMTDAADRAVADEERDVRPERLLRDAIEVLPERPPPRDEAVRPQRQLDDLAADVGDRRERVTAVAGQLGRVALVQVAGQRAVEEERAVRMAVRIDETRARRPGPLTSRTVSTLALVDRRQVADREDPIAEHADVGGTTRARPSRRSGSRPGATGRMRSCCDGDTFERDSPSATRTAARPLLNSAFRGAIAQLEEHLHGMQGVRGSSPRSSTNRDETADPSPLAGAAGGDLSPRDHVTETTETDRDCRDHRGHRADPRAHRALRPDAPSSRAGRRAGPSSACTKRTSSTSRGRSTTC